jgi:hypothetical protein
MRLSMQSNAHVIVRLQMQLTFPKIGIEHAIVADLDDVHPTPKAFMTGDFSARKAIARRLGHGARLPIWDQCFSKLQKVDYSREG